MTGLTVFLFAATACGSAAPNPAPAPAPAPAAPAPAATPEQPKLTPLNPPVKVKIGEDGSSSGAAFYIGIARGYFKELGIDAEIVPFKSSSDMIPAVATNQIQLAGGISSTGLYNAIIRGIDMRIIADKGHNEPGKSYVTYVVRKDLADKIKEPKDLKGRNIVVPSLKSANELRIEQVLAKGGLTTADVSLKGGLSASDIMAAMTNGAADFAYVQEPTVSIGIEKGIWVRFSDIATLMGPLQAGLVLASPEFVKNQELAGRFMVGYLKGARDFYEAFFKSGKGRDEIIKIMTEYSELKDPAVWKQANAPGLHPDGRLAPSLKDDVAWFRSKGYLEGDINLDKVVDYGPIEFALKFIGKYPS